MPTRVLAIEPWLSKYTEFLKQHIKEPVELTMAPSNKEEDVCQHLRDADVAIVQYFTSAMGHAATKLRLIQAPGAGYDLIDPQAVPSGVVVANCYEHEKAMAEFVLMQCIVLSREILKSHATIRNNDWSMWNPLGHPFYPELGGRTIGIVGLGRIGREVARAAGAFGMRRIGVEAVPLSPSVQSEIGLDWVGTPAELDTLLRQSDFVSLSVPLEESTRGLIDRRELALMKPTAYLINNARGPIVSEQALYEALRDRVIAGAAIDTWYAYPKSLTDKVLPSKCPFNELDNVLMTPHVSGSTVETIERRLTVVAANIDRLIRGEPLVNVVRKFVKD